jgi:hypothetical protein
MAGRGATDIVVTIDGQTYTDWTFDTLNGTAITLAAAPATGTTVRITRTTSQNARINTYSENTILTSAQLNTDGDQSFMMSQEAIDVAGETNLAAGTFYFSQANAPTTTRAGTLWYDLTATPNILKVYSGGDPYDATKWEAAVPIHDTKVYKNAANVAQGILAVSDASGLGLGANYTDKSYIIDTAFNSSGFVFLNGVKLIAGDAITDIAGGFGDYFHDAATNRVYFTDISNSDELVIETFSGSFSQEVTAKEASAQVAKTAAETAQAAAETAKTAAETAETNAAGHSSTASGHKDTATTQAGIATTKAGEAATSASTATTKASEAATSASTATTKASEAATSATNAANSATSASNTLSNTVTLTTSQTISGAKVFSANADFGAGIDVTGTVTADGLTVDGSTTLNTGATANGVLIDGTGGGTGLKIRTSETATLASPDLTFTRTGNRIVGGATNIGQIHFDAKNSNSGNSTFAEILGRAEDYTENDEDGSLLFRPSVAGTLTTILNVDKNGIDVTGTVTADGISLGDDENITLGNSNDLVIKHHAAGGSSITESGSGDLALVGNSVTIRDGEGASDPYQLVCNGTGATNQTLLYHGAATNTGDYKLATKATGVDVNGTVTAEKIDLESTGNEITLGAGNAASIKHDGHLKLTVDNNTIFKGTNGNTSLFQVQPDGTNTVLQVGATGIDVTGTVTASGGYKSSDGTAGFTGSASASATLTIKDGLIVAVS